MASAAIVAAGAATAQEAGNANYYAGFDYVSNYVSNGITQTRGKPTLQGYFEFEVDGIYAGTWLSGVDFADDDEVEIDLYLGYRTSFDNGLYMDVGYAHYIYNDSGECCGEFKLTGVYPVIENLGVEGYVAYNPRSSGFNTAGTVAYAFNDRFGLSGTYGRTSLNSNDYWHVGASVAFNEYVSGEIRYHGADSGDEGVVFKISLATNQSSFARLLANPFGR